MKIMLLRNLLSRSLVDDLVFSSIDTVVTNSVVEMSLCQTHTKEGISFKTAAKLSIMKADYKFI